MLLLLVRRRGSPCRHGSLRAPAGAAAVCMWAREAERDQGGPRACVGPHDLRSRMGAGARELCVSGADAGAPSDASAPDLTSGC